MTEASADEKDAMNEVTQLPKWVKISKFTEISGYSVDAVHCKRKKGQWEEGVIWMKAPDGNIMINWREVDNWVEGKAA